MKNTGTSGFVGGESTGQEKIKQPYALQEAVALLADHLVFSSLQ